VSWDISEQVGQIIRSSFICPPIPATSHTQTLPASLRMTRQTIITILLLTSIKLFGQDTFEITGQVISKHGIPLTGTNIVLHKTTTGTIPNACGQFKIKISWISTIATANGGRKCYRKYLSCYCVWLRWTETFSKPPLAVAERCRRI
jgi:hypothetical protein